MSASPRSTVQVRIARAFGITILTAIVIGGLAGRGLRVLARLQDEGAGRASDAIAIKAVSIRALDAYRIIADAEINLDLEHSASAWKAAHGALTAAIDDARHTADTASEQEDVTTMADATQRLSSIVDNELFPRLRTDRAASDESRRLDGLIDAELARLTTAADAIVESIVAESGEADATFDKTATATTWQMLGIGLVGLVLSVAMTWRVLRATSTDLRDTASALRDGAEHVAAAAGMVASSSQSLSQGATEQAASLEETSASMEEMASMTRRNAENAQRATMLVQASADEFVHCTRALTDMVTSTDRIVDSSNRVAKILKTIDEIAFQTNILALNAAVEAARAGEAGMGFAVVADEVRTLAQRSAQAAKDTAELIDEATRNAEAGSANVKALGASIERIGHQAAEVKTIVEEVGTASRQQAEGIDHVTQAIAQMEKVTQTTAATAEESAAASEELNAQAETSLQLVGGLDAMVGARSRGRAVAHSAPPIPVPTSAAMTARVRRTGTDG